MYVQAYSVGTAYNMCTSSSNCVSKKSVDIYCIFGFFVRLQKKLQKKMENTSFRIFYTLTFFTWIYFPFFFLEEREGGGVREPENWIIILVSGKREKSLFLPAGKCCVTRQNINIYKVIIFSFFICVSFY